MLKRRDILASIEERVESLLKEKIEEKNNSEEE